MTEHGNEGVTTDHALALVTSATSRRGLYVATTRGRGSNDLHVVTDTGDISDAVSVLSGVLASDRADLPAITVRRDLSALPTPSRAGSAYREAVTRLRRVAADLAALDAQLSSLRREVDQARRRLADCETREADAGWLHRRVAHAATGTAVEQLVVILSRLDEVETRHRPLVQQRDAAARDVQTTWSPDRRTNSIAMLSPRERNDAVIKPQAARRVDRGDMEIDLCL